jgi:hypothetical protein
MPIAVTRDVVCYGLVDIFLEREKGSAGEREMSSAIA